MKISILNLTHRVFITVGVNIILISAAKAADIAKPAARSQVFAPQPIANSGGFYIGGRQGIGTTSNTRFATDDGDTMFKSQYGLGLRGGAVIGYSFGPVLGFVSPRIELEADYSSLSVKKHTVTQGGVNISPGGTDSFGDVRSTTGLVNGFLDINMGQIAGARPDSMLWRIKPFVGGGIGMSQVKLSRQGITDTGVVMDGSSTKMTWHASAGIGYQVWDNVTVEVGYRHMRTEGLPFTARDGTSSKTDLVNNLLTIGVRRSF
jgi:opacity protein-like surface antigen